MATEDQSAVARRGGGRIKMSYAVQPTMAAGVAATDSSFIPPAGSRLTSIKWHTPVAFTGTPTNLYLTIGKTAGGADYVANTDVKAATAPTSCALVAAADYDSWTSGQALFVTLTANGGTTPAGSCVVEIEFSPPNPYTGGNTPYGIN